MTGTLAQLISLTAYGNQWLRTSRMPTGFCPENLVFQYCNTVDFREVDGDNELLIAIDPYFWFRYLQQAGCRLLRLYYHPAKENPLAKEHQLAGMVGGGGIWLIECIFGGHSDFWNNRWRVTRKDDPDRRIWCVNYGRTSVNLQTVNQQFDLTTTATELRGALEAITGFAIKQNLGTWVDFFRKAAARLDSDAPGAGFYNEALVPDGEYSAPARQMLFAAGSAWAFGGMGSWNDQGFDDPEAGRVFDEVSTRLYNAINKGVVAAVNSDGVGFL